MLKVLSLNDFPTPSFIQLATAGIKSGAIIYNSHLEMQNETHPFYDNLRNYPTVTITSDMLGTCESILTMRSNFLFRPVEDSIFKKLISIWREKGFTEALRYAASEDSDNVTNVIHWIAVNLTWALNTVEKGIFQTEALLATGSGSVTDVVPTRDWDNSIVRCISWHPHCSRLAVATRDDRIRIFSNGTSVIPVLRHSAQKYIYQISWCPNAGRVLAAACHQGILVWTIELGAATNMLSHAVLLKRRNHTPVTSISWHPQDGILVSISPNDYNMIVWDVSKEEGVPIKRVAGGGLCLVRWSFCGSRLFSATCKNIFRVWHTDTAKPWYTERWTVPSGRIAVASFGPNLALIFASSDDPVIYSLPLEGNIFDTKSSADDVTVAVPIINLAEVTFTSSQNDNSVRVGGKIIAMEWDTSGQYLAVIFQNSPLIALMKTKIRNLGKAIEVKPFTFIKGLQGELPNCMHFYQKSFTENPIQVCLTIAWNSGRVQHFPIIHDEKDYWS